MSLIALVQFRAVHWDTLCGTQWSVFTADIFNCRRKSTGGIDNINDGSVPLSVPVKQYKQQQGPGTGSSKWNVVAINVIDYTCVYLVL